MAKTTLKMVVRSQELWGSSGQVIESINLGMPDSGGSGMMDAPMPQHNVSLYFPQGEGFKNFPMGGMVDVTFEPVKGDG